MFCHSDVPKSIVEIKRSKNAKFSECADCVKEATSVDCSICLKLARQHKLRLCHSDLFVSLGQLEKTTKMMNVLWLHPSALVILPLNYGTFSMLCTVRSLLDWFCVARVNLMFNVSTATQLLQLGKWNLWIFFEDLFQSSLFATVWTDTRFAIATSSSCSERSIMSDESDLAKNPIRNFFLQNTVNSVVFVRRMCSTPASAVKVHLSNFKFNKSVKCSKSFVGNSVELIAKLYILPTELI